MGWATWIKELCVKGDDHYPDVPQEALDALQQAEDVNVLRKIQRLAGCAGGTRLAEVLCRFGASDGWAREMCGA